MPQTAHDLESTCHAQNNPQLQFVQRHLIGPHGNLESLVNQTSVSETRARLPASATAPLSAYVGMRKSWLAEALEDLEEIDDEVEEEGFQAIK